MERIIDNHGRLEFVNRGFKGEKFLCIKWNFLNIIFQLETLWSDICTCLQSRYTAMFDSHFLAKLSPLLEVTFIHSRRNIKNQTLVLWSATFSKVSSLEYQESLKYV